MDDIHYIATFTTAHLGLTIQEDIQHPRRGPKVIRVPSSFNVLDLTVQLGDRVVRVNDQDVSEIDIEGMTPYLATVNLIRASPRPVQVTFDSSDRTKS